MPLCAAAVALAGGVTLALSLSEKAPQQPGVAQVWSQPRTISWPDLLDHNGKPFLPAALSAERTLVVFGYLSCPDICPLTLAQLRAGLAAHPQHDLQVLYITVDPARDTPERLQTFLQAFGPEFMGLTGTEEDLSRLGQQLNTVFFIEERSNDTPYYDVAHSSVMALLNERGQFIAQLKNPELPGRVETFLSQLP